jgi:eukaryotic-like serine/threonine-protein kinase
VGPSSTLIQPRAQTLALGRYRLLERLGAGGFGVVWRAHDQKLDREVALKRIPLPGAEESERATREALACARLAHPAIVALYEACVDGEAFYLISELVYGRTLARLLADEEPEDEQIVAVGLSVAHALAHAHARGVIHRDVKPQNVIVLDEHEQRGPVAKLADFGGARLTGEDALTRTGDVLGTLAYMAPEQSEGNEVGAPADVYSLALVLYEALSGVNPVRGPTPAATARRIGRPIAPLERCRRDLSRELTETIDAALEPDPRERAPLAELAEALGVSLEGAPRRSRLLRGESGRKRSERERGARPRVLAHDVPRREPTHARTLLARRPAEPRSDEPARAAVVDQTLAARPARGLGTGKRDRLALPRLVWLATLVGLAAWQSALGLIGVSLLVLAAGAPLLGGRRFSLAWLAAALAPVLGVLGVAGAFPALAGQRGRWRDRAALAALGFWWLALVEPLLARRLWEGPAAGLPARAAWEGSLQLTVTHVIVPAFNVQLVVGLATWGAAAVLLPLVVRGRNVVLDVAGALTWTAALFAAVALLQRSSIVHSTHALPRGALLGALLGCVLAVCARALRGPVCP